MNACEVSTIRNLPGLTQKLQIPPHLNELCEAIQKHGGVPFAVGGCVRDHLLGLPPNDFDLEVFHLDLEALRQACEHVGTVHEVGRAFGIMKVTVQTDASEMTFDVALPRRENKEGQGHRGFVISSDPRMTFAEASSRRDFTINAMGYNLFTHQLHDPHDGASDLEALCLRHVSPAFSEDPLRVFRACQFASRFGLEIVSDTIALCHVLEPELPTLSRNRLWFEFKKLLLKSPWPSIGLQALRQTRALNMFPELRALLECPQEPLWHPEGDVWTHTLMVLDEAATLAREEELNEHESLVCLLGALCHDLGKPKCTHVEDGRVKSPRHESLGKSPTESFLKSIGAPEKVIKDVIPLVVEHLKPYQLFKERERVSDAAIRRLACRVSIPRLLRVAKADFLGRTTPEALTREDHAGRWLEEEVKRLALEEGAPKPLVQGRHLKELGVMPGPHLGQMLKRTFDAQLDGHFNSLEDGIAWVKQHLHNEGENKPL